MTFLTSLVSSSELLIKREAVNMYTLEDHNMLSLLLVIACFPQFITSSNLALTVDAANSTCTAACSTCNDTSSTTSNSNTTALIEELLNTTSNAISQKVEKINQKVDGIIASLSHIKDTTTTNAGAINDVLLLVEDLLMLHNDSSSSSFSSFPTSCQEIKNKQPNSPSGVYLLATANDGTKYVYCNMQELCGSEGGWTRLAYLDMTDSTENCPSGFKLYQSGGVRACGRAKSNVGSCTSVQFPSNGISYSQVCGRVVGYQGGSSDAVYPHHNHNNINSYYVDGVSITRGSPRQHVWTLMAGLNEAIVLIMMAISIVLALKVVLKTQLFSLSLVMTTTVNLVILPMMVYGKTFSTHLIHYGMVKDVVVLKVTVVQLMVSHGFRRSLTLPLLTTLS